MSVAEIGAWAWALAGGMGAVALGMLAYALWVFAGLIQGLRSSLIPEAQEVVREAHLILEEARSHVGLVAETTGRAEALMAAAEPSVERLAAAAEAGSQAVGALSSGLGKAKLWLRVVGAASSAAWRQYRGAPQAPSGAPASKAVGLAHQVGHPAGASAAVAGPLVPAAGAVQEPIA